MACCASMFPASGTTRQYWFSTRLSQALFSLNQLRPRLADQAGSNPATTSGAIKIGGDKRHARADDHADVASGRKKGVNAAVRPPSRLRSVGISA